MGTLSRLATDLLVPVMTAHVIGATSLAFIPPEAHSLRLAASAVTIALCTQAFLRCRGENHEETSIEDYIFGVALHTNCYLVLLNISPPPGLTTIWQKLRWGVNALFSPRMGTKPHRLDPPGTTKGSFLIRRLALAFGIASFWLYVRDGERFFSGDVGPEDWQTSKTYMTPRILDGTLTFHEVWFRVVLCFHVYSATALTICGGHTIAALIAVGIFDSPFRDWPPLFGYIIEAYSLRRWWSHFWHKAMRKAFTVHAVAFTENVLRLHPHTTVGRSVILLLSFLISGLMHAHTGYISGPCSQSLETIWSFMQFAIFILMEQAVQSAYFAVHAKLGLNWTRWEVAFWRAIGYCWVVFYLVEISLGSSFRSFQCMDQHADV